jgi:NTE family protein
MAVPVAFKPILIEPHESNCAPLPAWTQSLHTSALTQHAARTLNSYRGPAPVPFVHLVDGGVIDNLGLSSLILMRANAETPYAPFSAESAVRLRNLTMLVVNAENLRAVDWQNRAQGPTGPQLLDTAYDVTVEAANRAHYDAFAAAAAQWQVDLIAWRCALSPEEGARLSGNQDSAPITMRRPSGLSPGQNARASVSLTMATRASGLSSPEVKKRPLRRGMRSMEKYAGLTT